VESVSINTSLTVADGPDRNGCHADNPSPLFLIFENKISAMAYHFAHTAGYHIFQHLLATRVKYCMTIISKFAD